MLEKMGRDAEADPCCTTGDDIDLVKVVSSMLLGFGSCNKRSTLGFCLFSLTFPLRSGMSLLGSNLFPVIK